MFQALAIILKVYDLIKGYGNRRLKISFEIRWFAELSDQRADKKFTRRCLLITLPLCFFFIIIVVVQSYKNLNEDKAYGFNDLNI